MDFAAQNLTMGQLNAIVKKLGGEENARRLLRGELIVVPRSFPSHGVQKGSILKIDRTKPFDIAEFVSGNQGMKIVEQDEQSLSLTEIDLNAVQLVSMLLPGESEVQGRVCMERLKDVGHVRLDAKIFQILWENQDLIPESWKEEVDGYSNQIYFDGTILGNDDGIFVVFYLLYANGGWNWNTSWLQHNRYDDHLSTVLFQPKS